MDSNQLIAVAAVFILAGTVKGITGMGLPTVAVGLLGLWMPLPQVVSLLVAPSMATNVAQCRGPHLKRLARRLWPSWVGLVALILLAPSWGGKAGGIHPSQVLGVVLVGYGAWGLWRPTLPDLARRTPAWGLVAGVATGWLAAATAVFTMPLLPYLQSLRLEKDAMVQALGLSFTLATIALAIRVHSGGAIAVLSPQTLLALVAAFAGQAAGTRLRGRLSGPAFQRALFITFICLGAASLCQGG